MVIRKEEDIIKVIEADEWMMNILKTVKTLNLPDWWISAGFVRSKIWDVLHGFSKRTPLPDIDVIYYDATNIDELEEKKMEEKLTSLDPKTPWSVKNQARMHEKNNMPPYSSSVDGISKFTETVTALGVRLDDRDNIVLTAPWGIHDAINLKVVPTPIYIENDKMMSVYKKRMIQKDWQSTWHKLTVEP